MIKPPILNFSISRTSENSEKPFCYDSLLNLNVIKNNGVKKPFVEVSELNVLELITKTEVKRERDDTSYSDLDLSTTTKQHSEKDDEKDNFQLLETVTLTRVRRESDDEL